MLFYFYKMYPEFHEPDSISLLLVYENSKLLCNNDKYVNFQKSEYVSGHTT